MPFGSTGSFQLRKILSSKGVPFTDLAGIGPGTTNKTEVLKIGNSRDRKTKEMTENPIKTKSEHRSVFINIHLHAKGNGRVCEKSTSKCILSFAVQREHEVETLTLSPHTVFKTPCKVKSSRSIARGNSSS